MNGKRTTKLRRGRKWPVSVTSAARRLEVDESHLNKVLNGDRKSATLTARYNALVATWGGAA